MTTSLVKWTRDNLTVKNLRAAGYRVQVKHYRRLKPHNGIPTFIVFQKWVQSMNLGRCGGTLFPVSVLRELNLIGMCASRGGMTEVKVFCPELPTQLRRFTVSSAHCSESDAFCYRTGTRIALLKAFGLYNKDEEHAQAKASETQKQRSLRNAARMYYEPLVGTTADGFITVKGGVVGTRKLEDALMKAFCASDGADLFRKIKGVEQARNKRVVQQ